MPGNDPFKNICSCFNSSFSWKISLRMEYLLNGVQYNVEENIKTTACFEKIMKNGTVENLILNLWNWERATCVCCALRARLISYQ